jgi:hypothetical protein
VDKSAEAGAVDLTEWCPTCRRCLEPNAFGCVSKANCTRPAGHRRNERREAEGREG